MDLWDYVSQRKCLSERIISVDEHDNLGLVDFLKEKGLIGTVTKPSGFVDTVVHEFYSNLTSYIRGSSSPRYCKVYVRCHVFEFSPTMINNYLECPTL